MTDLGKRRTLTVFACAIAGSCLPRVVQAAKASGQDNLRRWRGTAMGAQATILLEGVDTKTADRLIGNITTEIDRLENIFSMYRPNSTLCRLNADGFVDGPEQEFIELMSKAQHYADITNGAFDPTVQPLWLALEGLSSRNVRDKTEIRQTIDTALGNVGYRHVSVAANRVSFARSGMRATLNGIAQGYLTDRIATLLRNNGLKHVLVDLGEQRAVGPRANGDKWHARIKSPLTGLPGREAIDLYADALATSGGYGFRFDLPGAPTHLLDPRTGASPKIWNSISVKAGSATEADALSTAFSMMTQSEIRKTLPLSGASFVLGLPVSGDRPIRISRNG